MSYPVMAEPPLDDGAVHESDTWEFPAVAVRPVGDPGTVAALAVVAEAVFDGELVPTELMADTWYV
jgi:hypothetical protein